MDFNVNKMASVVYVLREGWPHAVDELTGVRDTPEMARLLRQRYPKQVDARRLAVYPDASGQNTSSKSASEDEVRH